MSPTRKAATWRDSSGVPATAHRADVSALRPKTQTRARRQYQEPVGLAPPGHGHESGGARARRRVAEAVEDEHWERTPREPFSISFAAQCRAQA